MKSTVISLLLASVVLSGCGTKKSLVEEACESFIAGNYELSDSRFAELVREKPEVSDYREFRKDLSILIGFAEGRIDSEGNESLGSNVTYGHSTKPSEAMQRLNYFCKQ
jgi:hypothetical protein